MLSALVLGLLAVACSDPTCPDLVVKPIQITRVDVRILESAPPQVLAHVEGVLADACTEVHSVDQERRGRRVTVTILGKRPRDAMCAQVSRRYESDITIEGQYPPGEYVLSVNDHETTFTTD